MTSEVIPFITVLEKVEILKRGRTYTFTNERRFEQVIFSTQQSSAGCRLLSQEYITTFIELFEKTVNKNENRFHQQKAAEVDDAPRDQLGTVRFVSSISRPVLLIGGRLVGWFLRFVPGNKSLAPVVVSYST